MNDTGTPREEERRTQPSSQPSPQSVTRVVRILEALCAKPGPASLAELSRELATPKSSLAALLRGLSHEGFVVPVDGGWRLGAGAFGLGSALLEARRRLQSSDLVRDGMRRLADKTGETVLLGVHDPSGETMTYVDMVESRNPVRFAVSVGDRRMLYATSGGRMLLAGLPDAALQTYFARFRPARITPTTETGKSALLAAVVQARNEGVAQTVDQAGEGVTGTAAPVYDAAQVVIGALIVAAPSMRWQDRRADLARMVRSEAQLISRSLGYRG
jgi:DNA-binding IclR family transcriptional regulator